MQSKWGPIRFSNHHYSMYSTQSSHNNRMIGRIASTTCKNHRPTVLRSATFDLMRKKETKTAESIQRRSTERAAESTSVSRCQRDFYPVWRRILLSVLLLNARRPDSTRFVNCVVVPQREREPIHTTESLTMPQEIRAHVRWWRCVVNDLGGVPWIIGIRAVNPRGQAAMIWDVDGRSEGEKR